ncbi:MAG: transglycosylase domain-containing protein [Alphaproteobacteria bacterium]|nr:transglycosylase domain-containing protein [Alphaproteobacteria bacterium]MCB9697848.1 transglycosylase domain-containing protein [Alphaproteobacteria bacterium]
MIEQLRQRGKRFAEASEAPRLPSAAAGGGQLKAQDKMGTRRSVKPPAAPLPAPPGLSAGSLAMAGPGTASDVATEQFGDGPIGTGAATERPSSAIAQDVAMLGEEGGATAVDQTQVAPDDGPAFHEIDRTVPSMRSPYGGLPNNVAEPEGRVQSLPEGSDADPTSVYTEQGAEEDSLEPDVPRKRKSRSKKEATATQAAPPKKRGIRGWFAGLFGCMGSMSMIGAGSLLVVVLLGIAAAGGGYWYYSRELPTVETLRAYQPPTVTVVTDKDGELLGEIFEQRRYVVPIEEIPAHVKNAFLAAEDANFYNHDGIDYMGIARAMGRNALAGRMAQGASTITQQVARNFLLTRDKKLERKIKEVILSWRIEEAYDKDHILFLYLNEIFLGSQAYGVEAASRTYYGKSVRDISIAEAAILAGLPQRPSDYSPHGSWDQAAARQHYVLRQMKEKGFITEQEYDTAMAEEITIVPRTNAFRDKAPWFTEHVRRQLVDQFGEEAVKNGGLQVKTTCDLNLQTVGQDAVRDGVFETDRRTGWRREAVKNAGAANIDKIRADHEKAMKKAWAYEQDAAGRVPQPDVSILEVGKRYDAIIVQVEPKWARVAIGAHDAIIPLAWADWVYEPNPSRSWRGRAATDLTALVDTDDDRKGDTPILMAGDLIQVEVGALSTRDPEVAKVFAGTPGASEDLVGAKPWQNPDVESALISMDLASGAVRAMVGGSDFTESQFNRAVQARRQVGSTFKPIVYAAAIESKRVTAADVFVDAPLAMATTGIGVWKPSNYGNDYAGPMTVRRALQLSKNTVTVRVVEAADPGMNDDLIYKFGRRLGIGGMPTYRQPADWVPTPTTDQLCPWIKEEADFTVCTDHYPALPEGQTNDREHRRHLTPGEDHWCRACDMSMGLGSASLSMEEMIRAYSAFATGGYLIEPYTIEEVRDRSGKVLMSHEKAQPPQVMDPAVASIATWLLEGVTHGGTGSAASYELGLRAVAGKTGTTNDEKDAWFVGYTNDVITAVWTGYDEPRTLGVSSTGGRTSLPTWIEYMRVAAPKEKDRPFPEASDLEHANIDEKTGRRLASGGVTYPFLKGTVPENTGLREGQATIEDLSGEL